MTRLSVTVITLNEQRNIRRCLESVRGLADEIVVVDSGSTDGTRAIVEELDGRFVHNDWPGHKQQKNVAVDHATGDWILSLDADEWIGEATAAEIRGIVQRGGDGADGWAINRCTLFLGQFVRCWQPDWNIRLFRKGRARWGGVNPHDSVVMGPGAALRRLRAPFYHDSYQSLEQYVNRLNAYTTIAARAMRGEGRRFQVRKLLFSPPAIFLKMYILKAGYRDGVRGVVLSASSAFYVLMKYAKLWWLEQGGCAAEPPPSEHAGRAPNAVDA